MMLFGFLWAALAPLSLVLLIFALAWWLRRRQVRAAVTLSVAVVLLPVAAVWWWDHEVFLAVCNNEGKPVILHKAMAEGVFLNSGTSNSFGMRYLHEEGFAWIEAPSIYNRGGWVRYEYDKAATATGNVTSREIPAITAQYEVREEHTTPNDFTSLSQTSVIDRTTGEVMARAGSANFSGGRMNLVLGAYGARSCPSAMSSPQDFNDYYHLAKKTLR